MSTVLHGWVHELNVSIIVFYFWSEDEGDMRLFNIPHSDNNNSAISSTVYQRNLKYSLCFKRPRDHCGVSGVVLCG